MLFRSDPGRTAESCRLRRAGRYLYGDRRCDGDPYSRNPFVRRNRQPSVRKYSAGRRLYHKSKRTEHPQQAGLRTLGRVDRGDAHLDTHELERARGITIFSKQARFETEHLAVTLLDTPGHADFAPEAERVMPVIDCALLLVSGTDGVQGHTLTLWRLLQHYGVPVVLFFNKMDLPGADRAALLADARTALSDHCAALDDAESVALSSEALLEHFLNTGALDDALAADAVAKRELFPCLFGSARQLDGIDELLQALERLAPVPVYPTELSARVYQIAHDLQGNRLTFLKVTGGTLAVRSAVRCHRPDGEPLEAKVTQLRLYSGAEFEAVQQVPAGDVCAALGLSGLLMQLQSTQVRVHSRE